MDGTWHRSHTRVDEGVRVFIPGVDYPLGIKKKELKMVRTAQTESISGKMPSPTFLQFR
jgi:hypothetical protein